MVHFRMISGRGKWVGVHVQAQEGQGKRHMHACLHVCIPERKREVGKESKRISSGRLGKGILTGVSLCVGLGRPRNEGSNECMFKFQCSGTQWKRALVGVSKWRGKEGTLCMSEERPEGRDLTRATCDLLCWLPYWLFLWEASRKVTDASCLPRGQILLMWLQDTVTTRTLRASCKSFHPLSF